MKKNELKELFASKRWKDMIAGLDHAYKEANFQLGMKQWQEFYNIAFHAGRTSILQDGLKLEFRATLPDGTWFNQGTQHLPSFLRRVLAFWNVSHPTYLKEDLEDHLQIKINGEWVQCRFKEPK